MTAPALSVVAPCYNEEGSLEALYRRVAAVAEGVAGRAFEIVLVNDGSRDRSWEIMRGLAARDERVLAVNLSRNHGHQLALTAGLDLCSGERILIIDADLQDPPELLPQMFAEMDRQKADVVYGLRRARAGETAFKRSTAKLFYRGLSQLAETAIPRDTGDFRLMSRRALDALLSLPEQARFIRGMVAWVGFRQVPLVYDRAERHAGETKYSLGKMVLGAVQMFVLGLIGEYLGRLYIEAKRRPLYIVSEIAGQAQGRAHLGHIAHEAEEAMATSETPGGNGTRPTA